MTLPIMFGVERQELESLKNDMTEYDREMITGETWKAIGEICDILQRLDQLLTRNMLLKLQICTMTKGRIQKIRDRLGEFEKELRRLNKQKGYD